MRSTTSFDTADVPFSEPATPNDTSRADQTARARIREAAMHLIGEVGFRAATVRAIATRAGVSPALVVHHFGSKEGLREAIDDQLADEIRADKFAAVSGSVTADPDYVRTATRESAPALAYLVRALTEGDEVGRHLYDRLYRDAVEYMQAGVNAGLIRPSDDPHARAAALLNAGLGQTLLQQHLQRVLGEVDEAEAMVRIAGPMLDLYTDGLLTDSRFRDNWSRPHTDEEST